MNFNFSLRQAWTALILFAVIVPTAVVMVWYGQHLFKERLTDGLRAEHNANERLRIEIESEIKRFETLLLNKSDPLSFLLDRKDEPLAVREIHSLLANIVQRERAVHEVIILSRQGEIVTNIHPGHRPLGEDLLPPETFLSAAQGGLDPSQKFLEVVIPKFGKTFIGSPRKLEGKYSVSMTASVGQPVKAILIALIDVDKLWLANVLEERNPRKENTRDYILDRHNTLLTTIENTEHRPGDVLTHLDIANISQEEDEELIGHSYVGATDQLVYGTVTTIPSLGWMLVSEVNAAHIIQPIYASLAEIFSIPLLGMLIFAWFVLYLANRTIAPVQRASEAMDQVTRGDYNLALKPSGINELDRLAVIFNRMAHERKNTEEMLRASEEKFRSLAESSPVGVFLMDSPGNVEYINDRFAELVGLSEGEILALGWRLAVHPDDQERVTTSLSEFAEIGENFHQEIRWLHKDGEVIWTLANVVPVRETDARPTLYIGTLTDLTEFKQAEEENIRLEGQYRQAQKMESIGRLAGGVAHDLNNLLVPILGYTEILIHDLDQENALQEPAEEIQRAGIMARNLVRKLLAFSRKQKLEYKPVDLNKATSEMEKLLRHTTHDDVELQVIQSPDVKTIRADSSQIEQVILNLSVNAQDAMTEGGNLTIETALVNLDENDARRLEDLNPGEHVMLTVSDTGDGMDEETRSQIYEPFFSTKGEQGTGLGLATVHGIVKQHGGHIEVDSELGQGTTFKVYLPVSSYEPISDDAIAEPRTSLMGSETIMLVDDDEPVRLLAETFLKRQGYNVLSAHSGEESLAILDRHREPLHLLLTDVVMPGLNGKELFEKAVERKGNLKVLYMSGYTEDIVTDRGGLDKDTDLIHKPFSINALATKVREILDAE
ncbi:MAG: hypothetical protein CMQ20_15915 [Gammaproteobacteria bacterium]|jgi:PAS domain S-box-containing protein|nr:hypothetical protein [Gammaproteobacteria bacterium]|tara:strand:+ start:279 stop:2948 length:2670 start_codon:yes stop_codon:yes gene_type:complete